jgi:hypothetical protein
VRLKVARYFARQFLLGDYSRSSYVFHALLIHYD